MRSEASAYCRVCGYEPGLAPWGEDGISPSWEICACCGVEFGYEDATAAGVVSHRARWLADGGLWADRTIPMDGLSVADRLARVVPNGRK